MNTEILIKVRKDSNIKQIDISKMLGIKQGTYSDYERGKAVIPLDSLNIISNKCDASLDYLVGLTKYNDKNFKHIDLNHEDIGKQLRLIRKTNNLTQKSLADKLNVARPRISDYENGKRLTVIVLIDYSNFFGKSIDYLCCKK